jgi:ribonuclease HI
MNDDIVVYTDGGCIKSEGPGGWAWRAEWPDGSVFEDSGSDPVTTNNRMEMMAAIRAMEALPLGCTALLTTDSQYLQQGYTTWCKGWIARGWRTADDKQVKNQSLWERMLQARKCKTVRITWVKGHQGNAGNERVDQMATAAIDKLTGRTRKSAGGRLRCPTCRSSMTLVTIQRVPHWFCKGWEAHPAHEAAE